MIDVTLLGSVDDGRPVLRSGARVGDSLLVTGRLGAAAAGLRLMLTETGPLVATQALKGLLDAQRRPTPRVHEGWIIGSSGLASAMIDISDGLTADLGHLCDASRVGVVVNAAALPIDPATTDAAARLDADPLELALFGGEDYELLFTAAPDAAPGLVEAVQGQTGTPVTVIGHITPANRGRQLVQLNGNRTYLPGGGWDHLRR
jgi:thiamine-monophosphate kinase